MHAGLYRLCISITKLIVFIYIHAQIGLFIAPKFHIGHFLHHSNNPAPPLLLLILIKMLILQSNDLV